jgi:hypothetical protein
VGECSKMDVLELARRLERIPLESLVVGRLQKLEICGTGDGASWVGYRQEVGLAKGMGFAHNWYSRESGGAPDIGRPLQGVVNERFDKLGSRKVVPAVRAIEAIVHSLQQPAPFFCMHVNGCENCLTFAHFLPHDGCDEEPYDGRTYGQPPSVVGRGVRSAKWKCFIATPAMNHSAPPVSECADAKTDASLGRVYAAKNTQCGIVPIATSRCTRPARGRRIEKAVRAVGT